MQVFLLLGSGMPLPDIAAQLKISARNAGIPVQESQGTVHLADDTALANYALQCKSCFDTNSVNR